MTRWVSSLNQAAAESRVFCPVNLIDIDFSSGHVRAHDGVGTLTFDGNQYFGVGTFGGFESIRENTDGTARGIRLRLSGVDSGLIATTTGEVCQGRPITQYIGLLNPDDALTFIDDPERLWSGRADVMTILLASGSAEIRIEGEHRLRITPKNAKFSDADQKARSPSDEFCSLAHLVDGYTSNWGGKATRWTWTGTGYQPQ